MSIVTISWISLAKNIVRILLENISKFTKFELLLEKLFYYIVFCFKTNLV